jgi:hypothetical protein
LWAQGEQTLHPVEYYVVESLTELTQKLVISVSNPCMRNSRASICFYETEQVIDCLAPFFSVVIEKVLR